MRGGAGVTLNRELDLQRVVVVGSSGSGKTTLAGDMAERLGSTHIELDALYWEPDWVPRAPQEFRALVFEAVAEDRWVIDGNYSPVRDLVWARASAIVWLDYSFPLVFGRVFTRTLRRILGREELFSGNRERVLQSFFSRDSILWWVITTYRRRRREYRQLAQCSTSTGPRILCCRRPADAKQLLSQLSALT